VVTGVQQVLCETVIIPLIKGKQTFQLIANCKDSSIYIVCENRLNGSKVIVEGIFI
jgi:hypothetical protein